MAINEHWGFGFEVNRDPNSGVRKDDVQHEEASTCRSTGRIGAYSATVTENRSVTHELTIGGILGLGGVHLHVPLNAEIRFPNGHPAQLEDIHVGDQVAATYQEVEHQSFGVADERGPCCRYEAVSMLVSPQPAD